MEKLHDRTGLLEEALEFRRRGLRLVPLEGKRPFLKSWHDLDLTETEICRFSERGVNWGAITGELIVVDTDSTGAEREVRHLGIKSSVEVWSGGGGRHRWFRKPAEIDVLHGRLGANGVPGFDVKGHHGLIVLPGSIHPETGQRYEFVRGRKLVDLTELPVFDLNWIQEEKSMEPVPMPKTQQVRQRVTGQIRDVRAYLRAIPSIQGQNGSKALMRVCYVLIDQGYSFDAALAELAIWSEVSAVPQWSQEELIRALGNAFKRKIESKLK